MNFGKVRFARTYVVRSYIKYFINFHNIGFWFVFV